MGAWATGQWGDGRGSPGQALNAWQVSNTNLKPQRRHYGNNKSWHGTHAGGAGSGITTYNALRHSGAMPGDLVAVLGIGGLGHLGIQFANKFGYKVAEIGRGSENAALAKKLGANVYIDSKSTNAAGELQKLGGAQVILATAPSSKAMSEMFDGLGPNGKLMAIGVAFDPIEVTPLQLVTGSRAIQGWVSGTSADEEDTLCFAELTGVRPMIETYPFEKAAEAYARMMSGKAQFRVVLTM